LKLKEEKSMELITKKLEDFKIDIPISWEDITNQISI
jgi:hypothetical protein